MTVEKSDDDVALSMHGYQSGRAAIVSHQCPQRGAEWSRSHDAAGEFKKFDHVTTQPNTTYRRDTNVSAATPNPAPMLLAAQSTGPAIVRPVALRSPRVLFIGGSMNQTTQMHQIAQAFPECDAWFTAHYASGIPQAAARTGILDFTVLGGQAKRRSESFFDEQGLQMDYEGRRNRYDLIVSSSDLVVPANTRDKPIVVVQEGMMDPERWIYYLVKALRLPRWLANTSMTGQSHQYRAFCVASEGYREDFVRKGVDPRGMIVTGVPNFDNAAAYLQNTFPHQGYVLGGTSCIRETLKYENRRAFIERTMRIADGRNVIFKLHPNENIPRARREIEKWAPTAMILEDGNTNHMIANCDVLVTRYSSVLFVALALGKEVHADLPLARLQRLMPWQNGGTAATRIADVCREVLAQ